MNRLYLTCPSTQEACEIGYGPEDKNRCRTCESNEEFAPKERRMPDFYDGIDALAIKLPGERPY